MKNKLKVGKTLKGQKNVSTEIKKPFWKAEGQICFLILVNLHAPGSGSAFPIRIRIQNSQMNADPDPQNWFQVIVKYNIYSKELLRSNFEKPTKYR